MKSGAAWLLSCLLTASCLAQRKDDDHNPPLSPAEGLRVGRAVVADLLARQPQENATNTGTVRLRDAHGLKVETSVTFEVSCTPTNWTSVYATHPAGHPERAERLAVTHHRDGPNEYVLARPGPTGATEGIITKLSGPQLMAPFAGSDFWVADLGLEFLHWPEPRVLKKEMRKGRAAAVLEARDPHPAPGGYSRVVAWLDAENGGVLHADAYDTKGELIKVFDPTGVRKNELEEMEMRNLRTDSHTWIKFDLEGK